jgi:hypothetical protein
MPSGYSRGQWGQITTALGKSYPKANIAKAQNVWNATQTSIRSMNGRQQLQLHNSALAVQNSFPQVTDLLDQLDKLAPTTDATPINGILRGATRNFGANGPKAQDLAQQLTALFTGINGELANVYSAGGVPTDKAQAMADRVLNLNLPVHALKAGLGAEGFLINARLNAISQYSPIVPGGAPNPYINAPEAPSETPALPPPAAPTGSAFLKSAPGSTKKKKP